MANKMRFKDLPKGAKFKYQGSQDVWVAIETYGYGLIVKWEGINAVSKHQSHCSFVDQEHGYTLDSNVDVVDYEQHNAELVKAIESTLVCLANPHYRKGDMQDQLTPVLLKALAPDRIMRRMQDE